MSTREQIERLENEKRVAEARLAHTGEQLAEAYRRHEQERLLTGRAVTLDVLVSMNALDAAIMTTVRAVAEVVNTTFDLTGSGLRTTSWVGANLCALGPLRCFEPGSLLKELAAMSAWFAERGAVVRVESHAAALERVVDALRRLEE